jgi:hypothetical protein
LRQSHYGYATELILNFAGWGSADLGIIHDAEPLIPRKFIWPSKQ